ncbi:MAG: Sua5 family C-terminal domain-containing protein, partial [Dokdonella sp.]
DIVLDGGPCRIGIESTIVDLSSGALRMLRPGAITKDDLAGISHAPVDTYTNAVMRSPGMHSSHYAPRARVILVSPQRIAATLEAWCARGCRVGLLAAQPPTGHDGVTWLALSETKAMQAQALFGKLREADHLGLDVLVTVLPDVDGLGHALRDRLQRAAGLGNDADPDAEPEHGRASS